uniref:Chitin-binding type-1 domain-containing protein n=1 Tax=Moniliophthora roreri TaxID=221103 RepID=A0A0W0FIV2_MONRR
MRSLPFTLLAVLNLSLQVFAADPPADPFSCSPTQPCKIGCCGKNNVCGLGPDYCSAENCVSSCDQKSDCDPASLDFVVLLRSFAVVTPLNDHHVLVTRQPIESSDIMKGGQQLEPATECFPKTYHLEPTRI